jgi:lysophospholipid acyltransferase (LPLAT)-like uncharacterized protein
MAAEKIKIRKRILKSDLFLSVCAFVIYLYISLVGITSRWTYINKHIADEYKNKAFLLAFWHGRLLMIPYLKPAGSKVHVVISHHRDGELIAKVQKFFGLNVIRGSSSRGGFKALKEIIRVRKAGEIVAITPDGPRGPAQKVSGNAAEIAKMLEVPIIPVTYSMKSAKTAKSWDSFMLPHPFGKGVFAIGHPIMPHEAHKLEDALNELTKEADIAARSL